MPGTTMRANQKLIIPALGGIYAGLHDIAYTIVRVITGGNLVAHGWGKVFGGMAGTAEWLNSVGYQPGMLWAPLLAFTEVVGGLCLVVGLFTRAACVPILLFLLTAVTFHWPNGFFWNSANGGWEYPVFWAAVTFMFLIRGAGPISVDAKLGRTF